MKRTGRPTLVVSLLACLGLVFFTAGIANAQEYRGRVQGVVTDPSQAVVVGATVTLRNVDTGVETVRTTDITGHYLFDLVDPGNYMVTVELEGFNRFIQENILVQNRGDVTVNAVMQVGAVAETVTVSTSPVSVKFNTTTMELTFDTQMVKNLPIMHRNPFTLVLLNPAVVSRYWSDKNPFYMWAASTTEVGGTNQRTGDVLLDGQPVMMGPKSSYAPTLDATTEVTVQQNSVDAEYGHSSGGITNVSTKSGTNEIHGNLYYFHRNPLFNAIADPIAHQQKIAREHKWGGAVGHPIVKNRIFNHFTYEGWRKLEPKSDVRRLPTALERVGDFSQSLNSAGNLRMIYDPWTSKFDDAGNAVRDAFPGNVIPPSRIDPSARLFMAEVWEPNNPGVGPTGRDNWKYGYNRKLKYGNVQNRTDLVVTDNVRGFFRFSRFRTTLLDTNWTPNKSRIWQNPNGGAMHALNVSGDVVYTINPTTLFNFRTSYRSNNDDFDAPKEYWTLDNYREFFPNATDFYTDYLNIGAPFYAPEIQIQGFAGGGNYGKGHWWFQHPQAYYYAGKLSKQAGKHYLKTGMEYRALRVDAIRPDTFRFRFNDHETANTFISPNTRVSGDAWASFLLGAIQPGSNSWGMHQPFKKDTVNFVGAYIQDDFKISKRFTLNLGLRFEHEGAIYDRGGSFEGATFEPNRYSRGLDIDNPIPEFQGAGEPQMPPEALALMDRPYRWTGAWMFTEPGNRGMYDPRAVVILPRAGVAVRLNDRTSLRIGYARFNTPALLERDQDVLGSTPVPGFGAETPIAPHIEGVPQQRLSDPFPPATNPIVAVVGRGDGRYTLMGGNADWDQRNNVTTVNDRFNFTFQRETFARILFEATYFFNLGRDRPYNLDFNLVNPEIINREGKNLRKKVANPFYLLLPENQMRGPLRTKDTVQLEDLLKPFPHYDRVRQINTHGMREHYHSFQLKIQRRFANGFNFLLGYNYNQEEWEEFFNKEETFTNTFRYTDSYRPRHRMSIAGVYEFPFGRGRKVGGDWHPALNGVLGGWQTSGIFWYWAGTRLHFGHMEVVGDPKLDNPDKWGHMFNPDAFEFIKDNAFKVRTNPRTYPGVQGPGYKKIDLTLSKFFNITERFRVEFKAECYNLTNTFNARDPSTSVTNSSFGRVTRAHQSHRGREFQYNMLIHF